MTEALTTIKIRSIFVRIAVDGVMNSIGETDKGFDRYIVVVGAISSGLFSDLVRDMWMNISIGLIGLYAFPEMLVLELV